MRISGAQIPFTITQFLVFEATTAFLYREFAKRDFKDVGKQFGERENEREAERERKRDRQTESDSETDRQRVIARQTDRE